MADTGATRWPPSGAPRKVASPYVYTAPFAPASQYPDPVGVEVMPTTGGCPIMP